VKGERVGFEIRDLTNGTQGELASVTRGIGPKVGKYRVNLADLAGVGARGLSDAASLSEVIVIDEVGPMELMSPEFRRSVKACLDSRKPMLAVVHERLEDDLLTELRSKSRRTFEVSQHNRDEIADTLSKEILETIGATKTS
jgi:nucleoside-triphosphatase